MILSEEFIIRSLNEIASDIHKDNLKWWLDINTLKPIDRNVPEMLMLCVSELSEAMEGYRKNLADDKLEHLPMFDVELADCLIRIFDMCAGLGINIGNVLYEKWQYNLTRKDHTLEERRKQGGKKF